MKVFNVNGNVIAQNSDEYGTAKEIARYLQNSKVTLARSVSTIHRWGLFGELETFHPACKEGLCSDSRVLYNKEEALKVALRKDQTMMRTSTASRAIRDTNGKLYDRLHDNQGVIRALETKERKQMEVKLQKLVDEVAAEE